MYKYKRFYLIEELLHYLNNKSIEKENIIHLKRKWSLQFNIQGGLTMNKEIINLCKDVIIEEGNIKKVDCHKVLCLECPFDSRNSKDLYECEDRSYKTNLKIAHDYIKNNEAVNPNIEIGDIITYHDKNKQMDIICKVGAILNYINSIYNEDINTKVYYCTDLLEPSTRECAYVLESDIKEIYKKVKGE